MPLVNNTFYQDIGISLVNQLSGRNHRYINQQRFYSDAYKNPLQSVTPLYTQFWGPKVLSILVLSRNYGWSSGVFNWPPPGFGESKQTIIDNYSKWVQYRVLVWVDLVLRDQVMAASPDSAFSDQMEVVATQMEMFCAEMGDFGFVYKGTLTTGVDAEFFKPYIEEFWKG